MAVPQRRYRSTLPTQPVRPGPERVTRRRPSVRERRTARGQKRRFALVVLLPVLLMLGSVYLHAVSNGLEGRVAGMENELEAAKAQGERLEVEVAKLSSADRVRPLAREKLGMRDANSADLEVYRENQREDGNTNAGAKEGGGQR